jgi:biopolymer transport protein ExbB
MGTVIGMIKSLIVLRQVLWSQHLLQRVLKWHSNYSALVWLLSIILQVFYNYIVAKIDSIVNDMEDASITFYRRSCRLQEW